MIQTVLLLLSCYRVSYLVKDSRKRIINDNYPRTITYQYGQTDYKMLTGIKHGSYSYSGY
jgi:hypothetical protein